MLKLLVLCSTALAITSRNTASHSPIDENAHAVLANCYASKVSMHRCVVLAKTANSLPSNLPRPLRAAPYTMLVSCLTAIFPCLVICMVCCTRAFSDCVRFRDLHHLEESFAIRPKEVQQADRCT
eukprot:gnl/TRDRNA2_/TRDRNA2_97770_c0_seq1.p1 gnl/TRDRNA2_/TRDRNA2_97770_c0~~gnl/TRDRNA2_/TRDRNA2_97770_c0_seq1.p1  ORF type:complete len:125 (-),score=2.84 gnl/TRDRNA2_/TRDRNA2_97770_c0_seq1:17-391(-)